MKRFSIILVFLMFISCARASYAEEMALDFPDFQKINSSIKEGSKKHFNNAKTHFKNAKETIQTKSVQIKDKGAEKLEQAKENVNTAILKTG